MLPSGPTSAPSELPDEYGALSGPPLALVLSFLLFAGALGARYLADALPPELRPLPRPLLSALAVPLLGLAGAIAALAGRLRAPRGSAWKVALFLNTVAFALGALAIAAFAWINPYGLRWR